MINSFNYAQQSPLFEREEYQDLASRTIRRTPVYLCTDTNSVNALSPLDSFVKNNVKAWVYVYCANRASFMRNTLTIAGNDVGLGCFVYPMYKGAARINLAQAEIVVNDDVPLSPKSLPQTSWVGEDFWGVVNQNDSDGEGYPMSSDIFCVKVSNRPPFNFTAFTQVAGMDRFTPLLVHPNQFDTFTQYAVDGDLAVAIIDNSGPAFQDSGGQLHSRTFWRHGRQHTTALYHQTVANSPYHLSEPYTLSKRLSFETDEIIEGNQSNLARCNPKLLSSDYFQLRIESADGQYFEYDAQKLGRQTFRLAYTEVLTPDITRGYLRVIQPDNDGLYQQYTNEDWTGLVYSTDNSMIFSSSAWSEFISGNKNFFQMANMQKEFADTKLRDTTRQRGLFGLRGNETLSHAEGEGRGGVLGWATSQLFRRSITNTRLGFEKNNLQYQKQMLAADNVKAAPNNVQNASGNSYF